jgi:hypothetical protein
MTIHEFLEALKAAREDGYRAYLVAEPYGQAVRLKSPRGNEHCPLTAVCVHHTGQTFPPAAVYSTSESLELRACLRRYQAGQATDHEMDHGSVDHGFTGLG